MRIPIERHVAPKTDKLKQLVNIQIIKKYLKNLLDKSKKCPFCGIKTIVVICLILELRKMVICQIAELRNSLQN